MSEPRFAIGDRVSFRTTVINEDDGKDIVRVEGVIKAFPEAKKLREAGVIRSKRRGRYAEIDAELPHGVHKLVYKHASKLRRVVNESATG